jgi:hypothetical protein
MYQDNLGGQISNYFSNTVDSVISWGYTFPVSGNDVIVQHDIDPLKMLELPMTYGQSYSDSIYGHALVMGQNATTAGDATVTADGSGSLILGVDTIDNVIRIKLEETLETTVDLGVLGIVYGTATRTIYSYYNLPVQNEPIFIYANIAVNSNMFSGSFSGTYSSYWHGYLSIDEAESVPVEVPLSLYPNPASEILNVNSLDGFEFIQIYDLTGKMIINVSTPSNLNKIDVSAYQKGTYILYYKIGQKTSSKKVVFK